MFIHMRDRLAPRRAAHEKRRAPAPTSRIVLALGLLLTCVFLAAEIYPPPALKSIEYIGYDEMNRFLRGTPAPPDVAVVDVDERSLAKLGQWPWPRYRIAALIEHASALGARGIAMDFLFSEPDRLSLSQVSELYARERGVNLSLAGVPAAALDNDRVLALAVAQHNVVLGADLQFEEARPADTLGACGPPLSVVLRALPGTEGTPPVPEASGITCPVPDLAQAASFVAATNALPDRDGKVRRAPLVLRCGEHWIPSLALGVILAASGEKQVTLQWASAGVLDLRIGATTIPTDRQGSLLLSFRQQPPERFRHISAVDLLEGKVERARIDGKILFFGSSASGLQDRHAIPLMRSCPGIDLHALAADAILRQDFVVEPAWGRALQALIILAAGLLVSSLVAWMPVALSATLTAGATAALLVGTWAMFNQWGLYCSPVPGMVTLVAGVLVLTLVRLRREERRKELLRQSFARYVSAPIVDQILRSARPVNLSGERRQVTILMSDIRGFTPLSERMAPEDLVQFLNAYFAAMIDIVLANEGTLDKFIGDAVLALFGAPICHEDDALRAVNVAVAMQDKLRALNEQWAGQGQPRIRVGIGISTGEVVVGNIGSTKRLEYTAIGQHVNYAQRIEDLTKQIPADILISEATYEQVKDHFDVEKFGPLPIKGKEAPICVYAVKRPRT